MLLCEVSADVEETVEEIAPDDLVSRTLCPVYVWVGLILHELGNLP